VKYFNPDAIILVKKLIILTAIFISITFLSCFTEEPVSNSSHQRFEHECGYILECRYLRGYEGDSGRIEAHVIFQDSSTYLWYYDGKICEGADPTLKSLIEVNVKVVKEEDSVIVLMKPEQYTNNTFLGVVDQRLIEKSKFILLRIKFQNGYEKEFTLKKYKKHQFAWPKLRC
jgi:hypothetical protein